MRQKIKNLVKFMLILCITLLSTNCSNEDVSVKPQTEQSITVNDAKQWFDQYKSSKKVYNLFEKQTYNWEQAKIEKLENGLEAVTVPASNTYANNEYTGRRILYLYPLPIENEKGFQTTLYDVITKRENSNDLSNFNGYIIAWNLETGFANGLKFENNQSLTSIGVEEFLKGDYKPHSETGKAAPLPILHLDEVVVDGGGGDTSTSITVRDFSIGANFDSGSGISAGDYIVGPQGGGGGSGTSATSINSKAQFLTLIKSTNPNGYNITFDQNKNTYTSGIQVNIVPWAGIQIFINQSKIGDKFIIENVVSNMWGLTAGFAWSQTAYSQVISGTTTTLTFMGVCSYTLYLEGIGTVYSEPITYKISINNRTGKITDGKRL